MVAVQHTIAEVDLLLVALAVVVVEKIQAEVYQPLAVYQTSAVAVVRAKFVANK